MKIKGQDYKITIPLRIFYGQKIKLNRCHFIVKDFIFKFAIS